MSIIRQMAQIGWTTAIALFFVVPASRAQDVDTLKKEVDELRSQNIQLQKQLHQQQEMIDQLGRKFSDLQKTNEVQANDVRDLKAAAQFPPELTEKPKGPSINNVVISGEGAAGFFETGKNGQYPNAAFRVDEARLFVDVLSENTEKYLNEQGKPCLAKPFSMAKFHQVIDAAFKKQATK